MNRYTLKSSLTDVLGGGADARSAADAIVGKVLLHRHDLDTDTNERVAALTAMALFPEHVARPPAMSPTEALQVYEALVHLDQRRAAQFGADHADALATAKAGRSRDLSLLNAKARDLEQRTFSARKRLDAIAVRLQQERGRVLELEATAAKWPAGMVPALDAARASVEALQQEAKGLEAFLATAGEATQALNAARSVVR